MSREVAGDRAGVLAVLLALVLGAAVGCGPRGDEPSAPLVPPGPTAAEPSGPASPSLRPSVRGSTLPVIPTPPAGFYAVPEPLPPGDPGDVIWAERVAAPRGVRAWRVLYHSRTIHGDEIAVSGLVAAPDRPAPPGGFPIAAWAHGTTGLADACAPSRSPRAVRDGGGPTGDLPLPPLWELGFIVAATDYEGLGTPGRHPYLVGGSEGRGVLDSIRAARQLPGAEAADASIVLGISQGGHAALFAAELAETYAPDTGLSAAVALAPGSELARAAMLLGGDPTAVGFAVAIGAGFAAAYPEADLERILTPAALDALGVVDEGCIEDVVARFEGPVGRVLRLDALVEPPWPALLAENTPGRQRSSVPIFVGQGTADALVVPELTDALVERLCSTGSSVTYRRYPGASHGGVAEAAWNDVVSWIGDRLAGVPHPTDCD